MLFNIQLYERPDVWTPATDVVDSQNVKVL